MKKLLFFVILCLVSLGVAGEPVDYVNPQIGSISHLLVPTYNTVHLPHAMLRFNPYKTPGISDHYLAPHIYGFPLNYPGHRANPLLMLMPTLDENAVTAQQTAQFYDHDFETVTPYYYSVLLEDDEIWAEFTPAEHSAIFRFSADSELPITLILRGEQAAEIEQLDEYSIAASEELQGVRMYAVIRFNQPIAQVRTFLNGQPAAAKVQGNAVSMQVRFVNSDTLLVKYAVSYIDVEQAADHLQKEIPHWSFDTVKKAARHIWNENLATINISGGTEDQKTVFYTAFYRTFERMVNISEDGRYFSNYDGKIHKDKRPFYVDDWSWDTYRALHPLRILLNPEMHADVLQSYVRMYEQSGWMPSFPQIYGDMGGMIGHHQASIFADALVKGLRDFDEKTACEGLLKNAMQGTMLPWREGPATRLDAFYRENGFFPAHDPNEPETIALAHPTEKRQTVAVTLEHAYDDACLAKFARALGDDENAEKLTRRGQNYKNVYNAKTGFMQPKLEDGSWIEPFDPKSSSGNGCREYFAEVNSWTYTFHVQHDVPGLMQLMGGKEAFVNRLDGLFAEPLYGYCRWYQTRDIPDGTGMTGQFVMGNEQSFHIPYMYVYGGAPWKAQKLIRSLLSTWFRNDLMGICGDEDGGAMSAWVVFSSLGFYPVAPGSPAYIIGTPLFDKAVVQLPNDKKLTVIAKNNSAQGKYIQSATLNGRKIERAWLLHEEIANGGEIVFEMGTRPNKSWGLQEIPTF